MKKTIKVSLTPKPTRIGVVGCGYWGPNLIRNLRQTSDCELALLCDRDENRLAHMQRLHPGVQTTTQFEAIVQDRTIAAVVIATPVRYHHPMARACLEAGKHVLVEKPMTRTVAEGEELLTLARKKGLILMVGHTFLYSPAVRRMKEIIDSGDIGTVQYISSRRLNLGLFQKDINVAWDLAPHDISIILHLLEDVPDTISCQGSSHVTRGIEDVTTMFLTFHRNRCAIIQNSWLDPKKVRQMTVVGSRRMIIYDDTEPLEKLKIYDARVEAPAHYDSFADFTYSYHYGDAYVPYIKGEEPLKVQCQHFVNACRQGTEPLTNGQKGLAVVRVLETASDSLKQNGFAMPLAGEAGAASTGTEAKQRAAAQHRAGAADGKGNNGKGNGHHGRLAETNGTKPPTSPLMQPPAVVPQPTGAIDANGNMVGAAHSGANGNGNGSRSASSEVPTHGTLGGYASPAASADQNGNGRIVSPRNARAQAGKCTSSRSIQGK